MSSASFERMKLLLVSNLFPPEILGGYELLAADVVRKLRDAGHDVHVLTTGSRRDEDPPWVHRTLALVRPIEEDGRLDRLRHLALGRAHTRAVDALLDDPRVGDFDAAIAMSMRRLGLHVARRLQERGVPVVFSMNDRWLLSFRPGDGATPLRRTLFRLIERGPLGGRTWGGVDFSRVVYVSARTRDELRDGGAPVGEGVVALQGVDREVFRKRAAFVPPSATSPRLLFAGRLYPAKGCDVALVALARLRAQGVDATLTIAGAGVARDEAALRSLARELGVADFVRWLGRVSRESLAEIYRAHDLYLFPCMWDEPAGLTYLEAMACGVPVVAMARGGAEEYLVDEENALLVRARTRDEAGSEMADKVRALANDPTRAARLIAGGELTLRHASLEGYVEAIEAMAIEAARARSNARATSATNATRTRLARPLLKVTT